MQDKQRLSLASFGKMYRATLNVEDAWDKIGCAVRQCVIHGLPHQSTRTDPVHGIVARRDGLSTICEKLLTIAHYEFAKATSGNANIASKTCRLASRTKTLARVRSPFSTART